MTRAEEAAAVKLRPRKDAPGYVTADGRFTVEPHFIGDAPHRYRSGWKVTSTSGEPMFYGAIYQRPPHRVSTGAGSLPEARAVIAEALRFERKRIAKAAG